MSSLTVTPTKTQRGEARESARTSIVCARQGCRERITEVARSHGDPYCSRACAYPMPEAERECRNCGEVIGAERSSQAVMCAPCAKANKHGARETRRRRAIEAGRVVAEDA